MKNDITYSKPALLIDASSVANGATVHGAAIQLKTGTATAINDAITAAQDAQEEVEEERDLLREYVFILAAVFIQVGDFVRFFREVMKRVLGRRFSEAWLILGFPNSLGMPRTPAQMEFTIFKMWKFLQANPEQEIPSKNITAAEAEVLYNKIADARKDRELQRAKVGGLQQVTDHKFAVLRLKMRGVCNELKTLIGPLDTRWKAFGFNMPGAQETPDVPENIIAVLIGNNAISVKWDGAPRAEYYRVWKRVIGVDEELIPVSSPADRDYTIEGLPSAKEIEIAVSAVNNGGESQTSVVQKVTTL